MFSYRTSTGRRSTVPAMPHSLTAAAPREAALSLCALCPLPAAPTPSYAQGMPKSHSRVPRAATPSLVLRPSSSRTQALHTPTVAWDLLPSTCPASHASPKQEHSCRPLCKRLTTTPVIAARCMTAARTRPLRALCTRARARMPHTILRSPRRRRAAAAADVASSRRLHTSASAWQPEVVV